MQPALAIEQLSKTYDGGFQALKGYLPQRSAGRFLRAARAQWRGKVHHHWYYLLTGIEDRWQGEHLWSRYR